MSLDLILQLNEHANEQSALVADIEQNVPQFFEGMELDTAIVCEDAARQLANIAIQLGNKGQLQNFDQAVDMLAGLRALGSSVNRDALNVKPPLFKLIVQRAGENPQVDAAIAKVANHPSFASVRQEVAEMLKGATESGDPEGVRKVVNLINKLRLGYERVFNKLSSQSGEPTPGSNDAGAATAAV